MSAYFVTGGTGVIGSAIAERILGEPSTRRVTLLIRARSDAELASRLDGLLRFWAPSAAARERVAAVRGDATLLRFGLDEGAFAMLARECTHIVHCAAIVRMTLPLEEARRSAVAAAKNVIALARAAGRLEKIEFLSTVGVGGRWAGPLPERWITEPRAFHNTYEQAKAEAEDYVRGELAASPLPITIHRPSMVVGDSQSGRVLRFQIFYHLAEFLSGRRTAGIFPALGTSALDVVPVDYIAEAVAWSSRAASTVGHILHLCSGPELAVPLTALRSIVRSRFSTAGLNTPGPFTIPSSLLRGALPVAAWFVREDARRALATLPVFLNYLAERQAFANGATRRVLDGIVPLPRPSDYLERVLDYYLANRKSDHG